MTHAVIEFAGKQYIVIRWNPDSYKVPKEKTKISKKMIN